MKTVFFKSVFEKIKPGVEKFNLQPLFVLVYPGEDIIFGTLFK